VVERRSEEKKRGGACLICSFMNRWNVYNYFSSPLSYEHYFYLMYNLKVTEAHPRIIGGNDRRH